MCSGFDNENEIVNEFIRVLTFYELNENLQRIVLKLNKNKIPNNITAKKYGGINKADISIILDGVEINISVKKGSGNSIHQEPLEDFIKYLKKDVENNSSVFDDLRFFIWGDGTTSGNGLIANRISSNEIKNKYPQKVNNIQNYFDSHKSTLINRFLIEGAVSKKKADYLLFGDINKCVIVDEESILKFVYNVNKKPISIGVFTFQAWNRNIKGRLDMEDRRGQIQLKWGSIEQDLQNI